MPKVKKTSKKAIAAKPTKQKIAPTKKRKDMGEKLQQTLVETVAHLNAHWKDQIVAAKKLIDTTRADLKKAQDKLKTLAPKKASQKTKKGNKTATTTAAVQKQEQLVNAIQAKLTDAKHQQLSTKLEAKKYADLSKSLKSIEKDAKKELKDAAKAAKQKPAKAKKVSKVVEEAAPVKATKKKTATEKKTSTSKNTKRKSAKVAQEALPEEVLEIFDTAPLADAFENDSDATLVDLFEEEESDNA